MEVKAFDLHVELLRPTGDMWFPFLFNPCLLPHPPSRALEMCRSQYTADGVGLCVRVSV